MFQSFIGNKVRINTVFRRLSRHLPDYYQHIDGVDYGIITKNHGQDYQLCSNEGHLVSDPRPIGSIRTHSNALQPISGLFSYLPVKLLTSLLRYCDAATLLTLGCASKLAYAATHHVDAYAPFIAADIAHKEHEKVLLFRHPAQKANYVRISNVMEQVA